MRKWLPNDIIYRINAYDFEAYFVGGCIRDSLIGRDTSDVDITTNMPLTKCVNCLKTINQLFSRTLVVSHFIMKTFRFRLLNLTGI